MKKRSPAKSRTAGRKAAVMPPAEDSFDEIVSLIQTARVRALQAVNTELIDLYWRIGDYLQRRVSIGRWQWSRVGSA